MRDPEEVVQVYRICIRMLATSSGDIRYDNRSYAAVIQRKSCVGGRFFGTICSKLCLWERHILQVMSISGDQESTQLKRP